MNRIFVVLRTTLYWVSVIAMALMLLIISVTVGTRYLFGYSAEWAEEAARYLFVWSVFIGGALIMGENGHLAVEFLTNRWKGKRIGFVLELFIKLCGYSFILILLTQGYKMANTMMFQRSPGLDIPMGLVYAIIPFSSLLMLLYLIRDTARFIREYRSPDAHKSHP
ncbi:MAG: TRAP transporter small permease [Spirochaetes bacterium]|nr:TRAP transporter small permease [Spirochaetota bacterium]